MGYHSWWGSMMRSYSIKNKLGFINGDYVKLAADSPQLQHWEICDDVVTSWILNSHTKEIANSMEYMNYTVSFGESSKITMIKLMVRNSIKFKRKSMT